ncbi:hypothetical protein [Nannocystis punicea]|uniref:Uncharacterized protein n=1 Tax=Nannocystis punicea TaxID=2995304 RepID=A0ABY7HBK0_9BACT|nr:hypothetical protein [Nannocystis poenicansa]WAS96485.1 hypothetical protein O0S08_10025 [Nannocystis poenicansa]
MDKPLPPQPWGFLATNQFWSRALLTPIAIIFWAGAAVFFTCTNFFALVWWQQALGLLAFFAVWGGLVERWSRRYFARRRLLLAGHRAALDAAPAEAQATPPSPRGLLVESPRDLVPLQRPRSELPIVATAECEPPRELIPLQRPRSEWPIVATAEFWDYAFERLFGRAAPAARFVFDVGCVLALFYPTWTPTLVVVLLAIVISIWFGLWQRRLLLQLQAGAQAGPALAEPSASSSAHERVP